VLKYAAKYYPNALVVLLGGSAVQGRMNKGSDLDVIVFDPHVEHSYRIVDKKYGYIFEIFLVAWREYPLFLEAARKSGIPSMVRLCAEATVILDDGQAAEMIAKARRVWLEGPKPKTFAELDRLRYEISEHLLDFSHSRSRAEDLFVIGKLIELLPQFILQANDKWQGVGKWSFRALEEYDPAVAGEFVRVLERFYQAGVKADFIAFVDEILAPYGGRQREGWMEGTDF